MENKKSMKSRITKILAIVGAASIIISAVLVIHNIMKPEPDPINPIEVKSELSKIDELGTAKYEYSYYTLPKENSRKLFNTNIDIPLTKHQLGMITYDGIVKYGYDVSQIVDNTSVDTENHRIVIRLSEPQLLSNELNSDYKKETEKDNILNPISIDEYEEEVKKIKKSGLKEAEKSGIVKEAKSSAEETIRNALKKFEGYEVDFA